MKSIVDLKNEAMVLSEAMRFLLLLLTSCGLLTACGYHFYAVKNELPGHVRKVAIPTFKNETVEAGIENEFTSALRNEFFKSKSVAVVSEVEAQGILLGTIKHISMDPTAHSEKTFNNRGTKILALEYNANVTVEVVLVDAKSHLPIWTRSMSDARRYSSNEDLLQNETRQREAYGRVATYLMEQVHDVLFEDF